MRKYILFIATLLISAIGFAQEKGDMFISGSLSANLGFSTQKLSQGNLSKTAPNTYNPSGGIQFEYGFFPANNLKLALSLGYGICANRELVDEVKLTYGLANQFHTNLTSAF